MVQYQLKPAHRLLMTPDRARFAVIHQQQLEQCEAGPLTVCSVMTPVYSRHHPSCLSALFLNDLAAAQQQCQLTVLAADPADTWVWNDQDDTWIYSVASQRQVVSQCQQGNQIIVHELTLHGTGHMKATPGCTLSTSHYQILPSARARGHLNLQKHLALLSVPPALMLAIPGMTRERILEGIHHHQTEGRLQPGELGVDEVSIDQGGAGGSPQHSPLEPPLLLSLCWLQGWSGTATVTQPRARMLWYQQSSPLQWMLQRTLHHPPRILRSRGNPSAPFF
ncbi:uncharacterized protein LOC120350078 [Nilaparvata lugens]|uniref:uncharacterized protein LOC120350078 n=1 Tax=Nilaparvata lugens TaxID=108931 RepID=UPI00193E05BE|nr:uncharacterized protein LOC120350078 [Nilaparvata lugens]